MNIDMTPYVRNIRGVPLSEEIAYWQEFEARRQDGNIRREWVTPLPHAIHGYEAFFRVTETYLQGIRQRQLVARFTMYPMMLFAVPNNAWVQHHDVHMPDDVQFNPLWFANERSERGMYQLRLFEWRGAKFVATTTTIMRNQAVYLYYGDIDNRNYPVYHPSPVRLRHQQQVLDRMNGWPTDEYLHDVVLRVHRGFHRIFAADEFMQVADMQENDDDDVLATSEEDDEIIVISSDEDDVPAPPPLSPMMAANYEAPIPPSPPRAVQPNYPWRMRRPPSPHPLRRRVGYDIVVPETDSETETDDGY